MTRQLLLNHLKKQGYKITKQRRQMLELLLDHRHKLMTAEKLFSALKAQLDDINITTVYRNLEQLERLGAVHKTILQDQTTYYKLKCQDHHHHHMICQCCGGITVIDYCPLTAVEAQVKMADFTIKQHTFEIVGICHSCLDKAKDAH